MMETLKQRVIETKKFIELDCSISFNVSFGKTELHCFHTLELPVLDDNVDEDDNPQILQNERDLNE